MIADLASFFLFALIASITPGPNNIILTTVGARYGVLHGMPALLGTALGFGLMLFTVAMGLGSIILSNQLFLDVLRVFGTCALLWLAWKIATAPVTDESQETPSQVRFGFIPAVMFQWVNPKAWIVSVSIVATYIAIESSVLEQAATLSSVFIIAALIGCLPWLVCGAAIRQLLQSQAASRVFNIALGVGLALSVGMIFQ